MTSQTKKPKGWLLGLPYMGGSCLTAQQAKKIPAELRGKTSIFCDDILLTSAAWRECLNDWLDALTLNGKLILWISDVRYCEPVPGYQRLTLDDLLDALIDMSAFELVALHDKTGPGCGMPSSDAPSHSIIEADIIDGHAFVVVEKTAWGAGHGRKPWRKREKHMLLSRTGVNGDALMASSVLPLLKKEGWTITMLVRPPGFDMLKHNPHIDEFLVIGKNQLHDDELADFWAAWTPRFDRVINLNQTVEDRFLKRPTRGDFWWSDEQRRALCAGSYLAFTHQAAQVPEKFHVKFYPSDAEAAWAKEKKHELGKFVLWALQGSAVHKWWPYTQQAICQLLGKTDYTFVLCGDDTAHDLANSVTQAVIDYFGDAKRLKSLVNVKSLREVMALAQVADIVIGPETSVMNAVSFEPMPKILMLSHSAASNLSDDWVNTTALVPNAPCYPCHRLHYGHAFCPQDKATQAAACAASIHVSLMVDAVMLAAGAHEKPELRVVSA